MYIVCCWSFFCVQYKHLNISSEVLSQKRSLKISENCLENILFSWNDVTLQLKNKFKHYMFQSTWSSVSKFWKHLINDLVKALNGLKIVFKEV